MGIWDFIKSGEETVKYYTPAPLKLAGKTSYDYGAHAVKKIDDAVRVNGVQKLGEYMPDDEGRAKIVSFGTKFVKNVTVYCAKEAANFFIPGAKVVTNIYSQTAREVEAESRKKPEELHIKDITGSSSNKIFGNGAVQLTERKELEMGSENRVPVNSFAHQTPEDVLRVFMMKEFMGTRFFDDLLVPSHGKRKKV